MKKLWTIGKVKVCVGIIKPPEFCLITIELHKDRTYIFPAWEFAICVVSVFALVYWRTK